MEARRSSGRSTFNAPKRTNSFASGIGVDVRKIAAAANAANAAVSRSHQHRSSIGTAPSERPRARLQRSMSVSDGITSGQRSQDGHDQEADILGLQAQDPEAEWKIIQVKTFTRWCNQHLKDSDYEIEDLAVGFEDGRALITLVESLAGRRIGKYNRAPKRLPQKLENVGMVLKFLQFEEGLKLVNIGNTDIVMDHNLKLILGLVWHLILHYQVSLLALDGSDGKRRSSVSPKDMLLRWLREKLAPREVANLTTAWNNGKLIAALVDVLAPGLYPGADDVDPANNVQTATNAMKLAEDWLGVPQVLQPTDLCNPRVDEKSMMTYLSFFPNAKLKDGAPLGGDAGEVRCYGPALENDVVADTQSPFTIDASDMRSDEDISWRFSGPGRPMVTSQQRDGQRIVDVTFEAENPGTYKLDVTYGGEPISAEPLTIHVVRPPPAASRVKCRGRGLESHVPNEECSFHVDASQAGGSGLLQIGVEGTDRPADAVIVEHQGAFVFEVRYISSEKSTVLVHVQWHGEDVPGSPFTVAAESR